MASGGGGGGKEGLFAGTSCGSPCWSSPTVSARSGGGNSSGGPASNRTVGLSRSNVVGRLTAPPLPTGDDLDGDQSENVLIAAQ